eukprot:CAMPEP_0173392460 /NCGR_PEP_ID=MMETSP1356-20130122/19705_1 /TAXON_ID=77927 ORGANISM="Hemiselmis virescens, Strain PCC157" /NCGR_SAMPLE_ID=MMETSP1356 /ASSEMBLY_ACC=CAM_ASM_000847 /LENGTH=301 /DNA_ID=CAMNT_0014350259 /DNA_START=287 /DNA_END=1188 /DNA_ORIENTATION=+
MNGSSDPFYRYTMPVMVLKVEGTTKMIKSVLVNITDVCSAIGRPVEYLVTYLGQELSANSKIDKDQKAYVTGAMDLQKIQAIVFKFIRETVQCGNCNNPETSVHIEGKKKQAILYLTCKGCGQRTDLDSSDRFVKYMISHPPSDADFGHAKTAAGAVGAALADATAADEERKKKKKEKKAAEEEDDDDDGDKKKKKKKKDKKDKDGDESPEGDDDGEKKKKKKKKKEGDEDAEEDGEKKKKKSSKKKKDESEDSWDDDWGDADTSEAAVEARSKALGGVDQDKLAAKMERAAKVQEAAASG